MQSSRVVHTVSCHAEGEVGDVIVGGVGQPPGDTIWQQSRFIANDQTLRNFVLNEPRGGVFRHVNLLVPAIHADADQGWIIMEPEDTPPMSGSNSMCVATVLLETGIIAMTEPETLLTLEAPGGLIRVRAFCSGGRVTRTQITNVPSFVQQLDCPLEVSGLGTVTADIAYGGDTFAIVDAARLGFSIAPDEARDIAETGMRVTQAANEQLQFHHPENPQWTHISFCQMTHPLTEDKGIKTGRNTVVINPGKLDRSPCGTGCSARMAVLHARGHLMVGEAFTGVSIIDSRFDCELLSTTTVGKQTAIVPSLSGRAFITGTHQHTLDPDDPWPNGYRLADTWPTIKINTA